jgi:hypothetical protein
VYEVSTPLNAPNLLTATASGDAAIKLTWTTDTDTGLTGFILQSTTTPSDNTSWTNEITGIASTAKSITDTGLMASTQYSYRLIAVSTGFAGGVSGPIDSAPSSVEAATTASASASSAVHAAFVTVRAVKPAAEPAAHKTAKAASHAK